MRIIALLGDHAIVEFEQALQELGTRAAARAMSDGLNKAGDKGRTPVKRALVRVTGIKYGQINKNFRTVRSRPETLQYEMIQSGFETNLNLFSARQLRKGVKARPWNQAQTFPGTFIVPRYGNKVFQRTNAGGNRQVSPAAMPEGARPMAAPREPSSRFPIRQLWGPNLAREIVKGEPEKVFHDSTKGVTEQIGKQIQRRLGFGF